MRLDKVTACDDHAGDERGTIVQLIPLLGEVERHAQTVNFALRDGDKGLGQQGDARLTACQRRDAFAVLALPVERHVGVGVDAVFTEKIAQGVLGRAALARGHDGLALEVGEGLHALAVFHNVEHAQRVDRQHLHRALGFVVQHGGEVRGHAGHVQPALDERGRHLVGGAGEREGVEVADLSFIRLGGVQQGSGQFVIVLHELDKPHGGRPLERGDAGGDRGLDLLRGRIRRFARIGILCGLLCAGGERENKRQRQAQGKKLFE